MSILDRFRNGESDSDTDTADRGTPDIFFGRRGRSHSTGSSGSDDDGFEHIRLDARASVHAGNVDRFGDEIFVTGSEQEEELFEEESEIIDDECVPSEIPEGAASMFCDEDFGRFWSEVNAGEDHSYAGAGETSGRSERANVLSVPIFSLGERDNSATVAGVVKGNVNAGPQNSESRAQERSAPVAGVAGKTRLVDRRRLRELIMEQIQKHPLRTRVLHDIYALPDGRRSVEHVDRVLRKAFGNRQHFDNSLIFVVHHTDHVHVVHDCSYSNNSCRCVFSRLVEEAFQRCRKKRWTVRQYRMSTARIIGTVLYFEKVPRQFSYIQIGRQTWRSSVEVGRSAVWRGVQASQKGLVDGGDVASDDILHGGLGLGSCHEALPASGPEPLSGRARGTADKRKPLGAQLLEWLRSHPASPLTSVLQTRHWSESLTLLTSSKR